ncbi:MAG: DUF1080 domain-containing protein [Verrucomicrobia bacterium]|nr:DUF1080 domain-containing protein [Verrucomicrobiota bacterium]
MKPFPVFALTILTAATLRGQTQPGPPEQPNPAAAPAAKVTGEWTSLFNGKDLSGWMNAAGGDSKWVVENGAMTWQQGSGDVWTKARFGNFVLEVEFNTTGNSGVFFRTDEPKNCVQTGIEIQVDNPGGPDRHSVGAIYDLVVPTKNAGKPGEWNKFVITAQGPKITVALNGETVCSMDLDQWTEANKNPDGSGNKFMRPLKDWKREGHIGLQDHGAKVAYRNVRIKPLP